MDMRAFYGGGLTAGTIVILSCDSQSHPAAWHQALQHAAPPSGGELFSAPRVGTQSRSAAMLPAAIGISAGRPIRVARLGIPLPSSAEQRWSNPSHNLRRPSLEHPRRIVSFRAYCPELLRTISQLRHPSLCRPHPRPSLGTTCSPTAANDSTAPYPAFASAPFFSLSAPQGHSSPASSHTTSPRRLDFVVVGFLSTRAAPMA